MSDTKIQASEVLNYLLPRGGWILNGQNYQGITWIDDRPRVSEEEFEAGFSQVEKAQAESTAKAIEDKKSATAKLAALGLTADEARLLIGGN